MLEEYKDIFAAIAGFLSIGQMLSGSFICKDIFKAGSTKSFPATPFVGGVVISILFFQHGLLLNDDALGLVNFIGLGINIAYVVFFALWSHEEERKGLFKQLGVGTALTAVLLGYAQVENPDVAPFRFGMIVTVILFLLISAPLLSIKKILKEKNTNDIPFPMVISGFVMGIAWLLYGIAANQDFIVYQNLFFLILNIPQLILCILYPSNRKEKSS